MVACPGEHTREKRFQYHCIIRRFLVAPDAPGVSLERQETTAHERQFVVKLDGVTVEAADVLAQPGRGEAVLDWVEPRAATALAAVDALIETMLNDTDPDARYGSARALGQICQDGQVNALIKTRSAKALVSALTDAEIGVRFWASDALGKCGSPIAVEPLAQLLRHEKHEGVRRQAIESLQEIGGERAEQVLTNLPKSSGFLGWLKQSLV